MHKKSDTTKHLDDVRKALKVAATSAAEDAKGLNLLARLIAESDHLLQAIRDGGPSKATLDHFRSVLNEAKRWDPYKVYPDPE